MFFINGVIPQKTTLYKSDSEGRLGVWQEILLNIF